MREDNKYANQAQTASKVPVMPSGGYMAGEAGRQSTKSMLLEGAERLRKEAMQLEALAYATEHVNGEADQMLYRLLSAHLHR